MCFLLSPQAGNYYNFFLVISVYFFSKNMDTLLSYLDIQLHSSVVFYDSLQVISNKDNGDAAYSNLMWTTGVGCWGAKRHLDQISGRQHDESDQNFL